MSTKSILVLLNLIIITLIGVSIFKGLSLTEDIKVLSVKETLQLSDNYQVVLDGYDNARKSYLDTLDRKKRAQNGFEETEQRFQQTKNINSYETLVELAARKEYNIEALWIKLGLIAESNELEHSFNIEQSGETNNYNINVKLSGSYSGIRNFIDDIRMDMDLMFKAENLEIISVGSVSQEEEDITEGNKQQEKEASLLAATFVIKNIDIIM